MCYYPWISFFVLFSILFVVQSIWYSFWTLLVASLLFVVYFYYNANLIFSTAKSTNDFDELSSSDHSSLLYQDGSVDSNDSSQLRSNSTAIQSISYSSGGHLPSLSSTPSRRLTLSNNISTTPDSIESVDLPALDEDSSVHSLIYSNYSKSEGMRRRPASSSSIKIDC